MSTGLNGVDSARKATNIPGSGAENRHMNAQARVLIAVPFYKNEHLVPRVVDSLVRCAEDIAAIGGEVLFTMILLNMPLWRTPLKKVALWRLVIFRAV